ncbi:putative aminopeptidase W07G4.4 [Plodia interpunctella]|uniref:putative aminopeptidase W07G4.4 n=1 Tax=Plodia interpunctella TaxID=58824 RepID=UPI00236844A9|nr:putative aminopeptidase W07G4.4 [Plodia interpunctella]XP_053623536.1 putative aminopeptidase W07G4.4 [Plodia interpunctella]XP_053623542.1 putative aminopeptidase W07G4.4 [Plodia interpunctella]
MSENLEVHGCGVRAAGELADARCDAVVVLLEPGLPPPQALEDFIVAAQAMDKGLDKECAVLKCERVSGQRLVLSPTGPLTDYDDVRSVGEAAAAGLRRAGEAGSRRPLLVLQQSPRWPRAPLVALLAALETLYVPLQIRETFPDSWRRPEALAVYAEGVAAPLDRLLREAVALEAGRGLARDIGGADPERATPLRCAELIRRALGGGAVAVHVEERRSHLEQHYPLLAAVSRCADAVPRHRACVVQLTYTPPQHAETLLLVGKGVTYDTGGCDIKAGGVMAGMSRDKCGAAAIAGFLKTCDILRPNVRVVASLGFVRNSVGSEAYVSDELLRSRTKLAVRVGNTDAEGRMVMADLLAELAERSRSELRPHLYTVATLTGHAARAYGAGYTAAVDNHAARGAAHAHKLAAAGDDVGEPVEVSRLRREDLRSHRGRAAGDALHQAHSRPSVDTPRGHQGPAAFLLLAAGLDSQELEYTHLDVAASAGCFPDAPTAAPLLALAALHGVISV